MLHISLSLMNRLNKTECAIFISLFWFGCSRGIDFLPECLYKCIVNSLLVHFNHEKVISYSDAKAGKLAADRWKTRTARQIYDDFCSETSFSALTRIHKSSNWCKRMLWVLGCLTMFTWLIIQCIWLFNKYFRYISFL